MRKLFGERGPVDRTLRKMAEKDLWRDVLLVLGCAFAWYGFDKIYPGAGPAVVGCYLMAMAALLH